MRPVILLVDDNPVDRVLAVTAFRKADVHNPIVELGDGDELMEYLTRCGRHAARAESHGPMVVLLDINMPRKNGLEVLAEIKAHPELKRIPVVMLTTSDAESDIAKAYALGANSFITKPLGFTEFLELVRRFAHYWLGAVALPRPVRS
jgi:CheY-like chemotaxis protein